MTTTRSETCCKRARANHSRKRENVGKKVERKREREITKFLILICILIFSNFILSRNQSAALRPMIYLGQNNRFSQRVSCISLTPTPSSFCLQKFDLLLVFRYPSALATGWPVLGCSKFANVEEQMLVERVK